MTTPPGPPRRPQPRKYLDAGLVPLERALLARAGVLDEESRTAQDPANVTAEGRGSALLGIIAAELRELADELHYW